MSEENPAATVVVATRNRAARLASLIESLRAQTLAPERFEVVIVDDGSSDGTTALLEQEQRRDGLWLRSIRREEPGGPGAARNEGWRQARAPLVAFIDDDCVATPGWLEAALDTARSNPGAIVQGRTEPDPVEEATAGPFSYTIRVPRLGPHYETCNILYPRDLLERMGGFDTTAFPGGGEDSDLAWRALESGATAVFVPDAHVFHAVHRLGPVRHLKRAWHWTDTMLVFARHPGLREAHLFRGAFWKVEHYGLVRVLLLPLIPRRLRLLRRWFGWRWLAELALRANHEVGAMRTPLLVPYMILHDLVEIAAVLRGAIRYRTLVL